MKINPQELKLFLQSQSGVKSYLLQTVISYFSRSEYALSGDCNNRENYQL